MLGFKCANGSQDTLLKQVTYSEAERIWDRPESLRLSLRLRLAETGWESQAETDFN